MRPAEVVRRAADYLSRHDVPSPLPTAEILLADILGTDRAGLYAQGDGLTSAEAKRFGRALCVSCTGTPVQHVTGRQAFRRLDLEVRPGVFIPRPETEVLVETALSSIADVAAPIVVDVGTGTGAVALAVKDERPDARVLATDVSTSALALAADNAHRLGLDVELLEGDLLDPVPRDLIGSLNAVVSNPPYVDPSSASQLTPEVRADPPEALFATPELTARLLHQAADRLRSGGAVAIEIDESTGATVRRAARGAGFVLIRVLPDLAGRDRVLTARRR